MVSLGALWSAGDKSMRTYEIWWQLEEHLEAPAPSLGVVAGTLEVPVASLGAPSIAVGHSTNSYS